MAVQSVDTTTTGASERFTRIVRAIIFLIVGVIVLNLIRIGTDLLSTRLNVTSELKSLLYLIPMTAILVFNGLVVSRLRDRLLSLVYSAMMTLVVVTELGRIYAFGPGNSALVRSLLDGGVMLLIGVIFYRATTLLMETYQQRHEVLLENLAYGTSHRVGQDFLAGLVASIATTLRVPVAFVSEIDSETLTETIISSAGTGEGTVAAQLVPGTTIRRDEEVFTEGIPGYSVYQTQLTNADGGTIGHLILFHKPSTISPGQRSSLQIFASRASAELLRIKADRKSDEMEARMLRVQRTESLGVLAGGIAHDFNNLLQAIRGFSAVAADTCATDTPTHQAIVRINGVVDKGAMLCDRLLTYAGRSVRKNDVCDINNVVRETVHIIQAARTDCAISLHLADTSLPVWGDAAQLSQVLMNLLTNAGDSVDGANGEIEVHTEVGQNSSHLATALQLQDGADYAFVRVCDNGCGIAEEARERIFDPFYSSKGNGRGIGLAAVAGIVKDHLGDIAFDSQVLVGTTFVVALPISAAQGQPAMTRLTQAMPVSQLRVLLVDDDEMVRVSTRMLLETTDIRVTTAGSGLGALEIIEQEGEVFDSILIDQTMPGMSGLETCRQLRARGIRSPVILMSGYSAVTIDEKLDQVTFLSKPCTRKELLQAVSDAAESTKDTARAERRAAG